MSKIKDPKFQNFLTWSAARFDVLQRCEKRYYYCHVGSWGGWDAGAPLDVQAAYHLKYLSSVELEMGLFIHDRIQGIFHEVRLGHRYSPETEIKNAKTLFKMFLAISAARKLSAVTRNNRKLLVHEFGQSLSREEEDSLLQRIETLLRNFFTFVDVQELLKFPEDILPEFLEAGNFDIGYELGVPARPRTDVAWVTPDSVVVADWKCGRQSERHSDQALTYDVYVRAKLALQVTEKVEIRFYYLADGNVVSYQFTEEEREEHLWKIGEEFETLKSYSTDPKINVAHVSRFVARVSQSCIDCPFQTLCPEYLKFNFGQSKIAGGA